MEHSKFKNWLFSVPPAVRKQLIMECTGSDLPYLYKRAYMTPPNATPVFKAKIAIGLDKASGGQLDFRDMIEGGHEIDWDYVKSRLDSQNLSDQTDS